MIGPTNAGKSTLVNALVGTKVAIVSHKVQTTRAPIRGIAIEGNSQIVFIDTAGIFSPKRRLDRAMVEAAWSGLSDADAVLLVVDAATGLDEDTAQILKRLASARMPRIAVLNKIDRVENKPKLLALAQAIDQQPIFERIFMVSALEGEGVGDLRAHLAGLVPPGPWHYGEEDVTDVPMRIQAAEMTRECIYRFLHQELPYTTTVETTGWKTFKDGSARIEQTIYVERDSQKKIVLGKGGATVKKISSDVAAGRSRRWPVIACICFCSSKCVRTGRATRAVSGNGLAFSQVVSRLCTEARMQWTDEGIVLSVRSHGETAAVVDFGRVPTAVTWGSFMAADRGGSAPVLQAGNQVDARWKARLPITSADESLRFVAPLPPKPWMIPQRFWRCRPSPS